MTTVDSARIRVERNGLHRVKNEKDFSGVNHVEIICGAVRKGY